jgi:hypothetical protein
MHNKSLYAIIVTLIIIIFLQKSCNNKINTVSKVVVKTDTIWKVKHDTILKTVNVIKKVYVKPEGDKYIPGETIDTCKLKFENLLKEHSFQTVYLDTLKLDSLGTIVIKDTIWLNKFYGKRSYIKNYKIPLVTKTITKEKQPVRQLYAGVNIFGNVNSIELPKPGIIYKDRKDRIYQVNISIDLNGNINYGLGAYWKIKFKK